MPEQTNSNDGQTKRLVPLTELKKSFFDVNTTSQLITSFVNKIQFRENTKKEEKENIEQSTDNSNTSPSFNMGFNKFNKKKKPKSTSKITKTFDALKKIPQKIKARGNKETSKNNKYTEFWSGLGQQVTSAISLAWTNDGNASLSFIKNPIAKNITTHLYKLKQDLDNLAKLCNQLPPLDEADNAENKTLSSEFLHTELAKNIEKTINNLLKEILSNIEEKEKIDRFIPNLKETLTTLTQSATQLELNVSALDPDTRKQQINTLSAQIDTACNEIDSVKEKNIPDQKIDEKIHEVAYETCRSILLNITTALETIETLKGVVTDINATACDTLKKHFDDLSDEFTLRTNYYQTLCSKYSALVTTHTNLKTSCEGLRTDLALTDVKNKLQDLQKQLTDELDKIQTMRDNELRLQKEEEKQKIGKQKNDAPLDLVSRFHEITLITPTPSKTEQNDTAIISTTSNETQKKEEQENDATLDLVSRFHEITLITPKLSKTEQNDIAIISTTSNERPKKEEQENDAKSDLENCFVVPTEIIKEKKPVAVESSSANAIKRNTSSHANFVSHINNHYLIGSRTALFSSRDSSKENTNSFFRKTASVINKVFRNKALTAAKVHLMRDFITESKEITDANELNKLYVTYLIRNVFIENNTQILTKTPDFFNDFPWETGSNDSTIQAFALDYENLYKNNKDSSVEAIKKLGKEYTLRRSSGFIAMLDWAYNQAQQDLSADHLRNTP